MYFRIHENILPSSFGETAAELAVSGHHKDVFMSRKKAKNQDGLLSHPIIMRVSESELKKLKNIQANSNCQSLGEVVRKILQKQRILYFHKDISLNGPMEELSSIRKELKAIGINIYSILDKDGNKIGIPFKANSLNGKPTLKNIEEKFRFEFAPRKSSN